MKIKNFKTILSMALVGSILLGGTVAFATPNNVETTNVIDKQNVNVEEVLNKVSEIENKLNSNEELTIEEYRETLDYLTKVMPSLVEDNVPVVGDGVQEVSYFLQLEQARKDVQEFSDWLDTLEVMQPMSNEELNSILND